MATNIAVLDDYQDVALSSADWSELSGHSSITVFNDYIADQDRLIETLQPFEVVVAMRERTPFPADVIRALPRLKLLITTGPANASIDVAAATEQGITVCGTGGLLNPTSELTWGLILAVARNIAQEDQAIRAGRWQTSVGIELGGRTLGIIGLGKLGQRVARVAHAFDMNVIAWSQNLTAETAAEHGATLVTKEVLFAESDIVTVHLVLSDRTRGLIGSAELGLMKPTSYLVNTSRGPIVDEAALVAALASGAIAGAGLDVFDREPLPSDHPFRSLANTVLTPHIGYVGQETYRIFYADIVDDISNWLAGTPVRVIS
jgi:phosphoglycerate dehydrogenase-like enzyme